ncbi:MAG: coenzyme F420-0:L-glutamate ligase, partial [Rickettsiales bacterium]|jgi:F420-0:gamma-glutamyl ligase|nr:coenzyme F420-0:L-glutamate ligase [Rickettsiales bacterium]
MKRLNLRNLGIVSTDSRTTPLRLGVTGIATGFSGVDMVRDMRGAPDIFGRPLTSTQINVIDALASMAVLLMGEGAEQTPIVILRGFDGIRFSDDGCMEKFKISPEIDIYQPLLDVMMRK